MKNLLIRAGIAVLGVVITLTWWTIRKGDSHTQSANHIPAKVWAGGHTLEVEIESSCTAKMSVTFSDHTKPIGEQTTLETYESVAAGSHSWSIDVPAGVGGYVELEAEAPKVGDTLKMKIKVDGKFVDEDGQKLESPLAAGYVFAVQQHYDDYSKAAEEMRGEGSGESE
jgi:hypothetical protein